jgi:exosortase/archaeosortase family protein
MRSGIPHTKRKSRERRPRSRPARDTSRIATIGVNSQERPPSPLAGWRFPLVSISIAAALFVAYFYPFPEDSSVTLAVRSYLASYARIVGDLVSVFEPNVAVDGSTIHGPLFSMRIVRTCDAMEVNILLLAAIAAFPMPLWRRFVLAPAAVLVLVFANIARLCLLYWLGAHAPSWFDRTHQTLAPLFMVASALAVFLIATHQKRSDPATNPVGAISA